MICFPLSCLSPIKTKLVHPFYNFPTCFKNKRKLISDAGSLFSVCQRDIFRADSVKSKVGVRITNCLIDGQLFLSFSPPTFPPKSVPYSCESVSFFFFIVDDEAVITDDAHAREELVTVHMLPNTHIQRRHVHILHVTEFAGCIESFLGLTCVRKSWCGGLHCF